MPTEVLGPVANPSPGGGIQSFKGQLCLGEHGD